MSQWTAKKPSHISLLTPILRLNLHLCCDRDSFHEVQSTGLRLWIYRRSLRNAGQQLNTHSVSAVLLEWLWVSAHALTSFDHRRKRNIVVDSLNLNEGGIYCLLGLPVGIRMQGAGKLYYMHTGQPVKTCMSIREYIRRSPGVAGPRILCTVRLTHGEGRKIYHSGFPSLVVPCVRQCTGTRTAYSVSGLVPRWPPINVAAECLMRPMFITRCLQ